MKYFFILLQCVTLIFTNKVFAIHLNLKVRILKFGDSLFLGSISVALSVFPKKREERGLVSRPAVINRAYLFHNSENHAPIHPQSPTLFFSFLFIQRCGEQKGQLLKTHIFPTVFADDQHLNISSGKQR